MTYTKRNNLPKVEDYVVGQKYTFNINPIKQYKINRLANQVRDLKGFLEGNKNYSNIFDITVWPEFSPTGRLHFHGHVRIENIFAWAKDIVPGIIARYAVEVDTIESEEIWFKYCTKQTRLWGDYYPSSEYSFPLRFGAGAKSKLKGNILKELKITKVLHKRKP